jgi:hypothetical protein
MVFYGRVTKHYYMSVVTVATFFRPLGFLARRTGRDKSEMKEMNEKGARKTKTVN